MNCTRVKKKLPDYVSSDLSVEDFLIVDYHLRNCQKCKEKKMISQQ